MVEVMVEQDVIPYPNLIDYVYKYTPGPCCIRRLLVGALIHWGNTDWLEGELDTAIPLEFLRDMTLALLKKNPADENSWNEDTLQARLCIAGAHAQAHGQGEV